MSSNGFSLYNGISNRSRGWKSRKDETMEPAPSNTSVVSWNGAARQSKPWDNLRRDPELWCRGGNCFVHLYGKGQSQRGPAFKIPFSALVEAHCYPLIEKFISRDVTESSSPFSSDGNSHTSTGYLSDERHIELHIPAPLGLDKRQTFNYHLATRNFFAWVLRRSLVGQHLGVALATLLETMQEFRAADVDNVTDLLSYMDEEGYLDIRSQPSHALGILHFAEINRLRDLYISSFAHCCGMSNQICLSPGYPLISSASRRLMRRAKVEMDLRLGQTGSMLRTFLQDELSEAHLGLYPGARAHLERFRTLLQGLYAMKFGYYPPPTIDARTTIFEAKVFRTMRKDFEALYEYLVDRSFVASQNGPISAQGGICILQTVQSFDSRYRFESLDHPLPLLPKPPQQATSRFSWLGRQNKSGPTERANEHIALLKATNQGIIELWENDLVRAYRKFEEDSVYSPMKADQQEGLSMVDARKVRWILVYATYQALRQATELPPEVTDADSVPYNISVSAANLPPWNDEGAVTRPVVHIPQSSQGVQDLSASTGGLSGRLACRSPPLSLQIKPDINYLALAHRNSSVESGLSSATYPKIPTRRTSIASTPSRKSTVRRSFAGVFTKPAPQQNRRHSQYHEIVVHGYGNGTNDVEFRSGELPKLLQHQVREQQSQEPQSALTIDTTAARSPSTTSSTSSSSKYSQSDGEGGTPSSANTSVTGSVTDSPVTIAKPSGNSFSWDATRRSSLSIRQHTHDDISYPNPTRRATSVCETSSPRTRVQFALPPGAPQRPSSMYRTTSTTSSPPGHHQLRDRSQMEPQPLQIRKPAMIGSPSIDVQMPSPVAPERWDGIHERMEQGATAIGDAWEMYNDLGGLTELSGVAEEHKKMRMGSQRRRASLRLGRG